MLTETKVTTLNDFLSAFFPDPTEAIHLRAFGPKKAPQAPIYTPEKIEVTRQALLSDHSLQERLKNLNKTRGLYFVVNSGGDTDESIKRVNAFFAESDSVSIEEQHARLNVCLLQPSIRIETKSSVHAHWIIESTCRLGSWVDMQERLINFFQGDRKIKNPSRVMRLPFFNHISINGGPELYRQKVKLVVFEPQRRFTLEEMQSVFPAIEIPRIEFTATGLYPNWESLAAEARRRILSLPAVKRSGEWVHAKGVCHDGKGDKGIAVNMATGAFFCQADCATAHLLSALGLPEKPDAQIIRKPQAQSQYLEAPAEIEEVSITGKPEGIFEVKDLSEKIDWLYQTGLEPGVSPGWKCLERLYTVKRGQFSVVTGTPGSGKSAFLDALLINLAQNFDWRFAVCSLENQPLEQYVSQLSEIYAGEPFSDGWRERMSEATRDSAKQWLGERFTFLLPRDSDRTVSGLLRLADWVWREKKIDGLLIDPWNELEHGLAPGVNETQYTSRALSTIRAFAREKNVHVWLVAHPTKLYRTKQGDYPTPTLYDISGSAHFKNKCDFGIVVSRDVEDSQNRSTVHVQKVRFRWCGKLGKCELYFDYVTGQYREIAPNQLRADMEREENYGI